MKSRADFVCLVLRALSDVGSRLWVTGGKTPSEYMFSELPQLADIVSRAFDHLEKPLVLRITAFRLRAIPGLSSGPTMPLDHAE